MLRAALKKKLPLLCVLLILLAVAAGVLSGDRNYAVISTIVVILALVPFFAVFERRKPRARELVPIAVMAAIAVIGRAAFAPIPQFKPIVAIVIITGISFGAESGFLTGAVSMLASNFVFGQGPWTPWQMFACGLIGFIAGYVRQKGGLKSKWGICLFGIVTGFFYGVVVDIWSVISFTYPITWEAVAAAQAAGLAFNLILAAATAVFLFFMAVPMTKKLERIKRKYGLIE